MKICPAGSGHNAIASDGHSAHGNSYFGHRKKGKFLSIFTINHAVAHCAPSRKVALSIHIDVTRMVH